MIKCIIFDFNRTVYDPETNDFCLGALELFDVLGDRGIKIGVVSTGGEERQDLIKSLGIEKFIDYLKITNKKSEEDFNEVINLFGFNFDEVMVVGDRIFREIEIGNMVGAKTIWYKRGKFANELPKNKLQEPAHIIMELKQILDLI